MERERTRDAKGGREGGRDEEVQSRFERDESR